MLYTWGGTRAALKETAPGCRVKSDKEVEKRNNEARDQGAEAKNHDRREF